MAIELKNDLWSKVQFFLSSIKITWRYALAYENGFTVTSRPTQGLRVMSRQKRAGS
jgi:hypothetical protein